VSAVVSRTRAPLPAIFGWVAVWDGGFDCCVNIVKVLVAATAADTHSLKRHLEHRLIAGLRLLKITGGVRLAESNLDPFGPIGPALMTLVVNPLDEPQPSAAGPSQMLKRAKKPCSQRAKPPAFHFGNDQSDSANGSKCCKRSSFVGLFPMISKRDRGKRGQHDQRRPNRSKGGCRPPDWAFRNCPVLR